MCFKADNSASWTASSASCLFPKTLHAYRCRDGRHCDHAGTICGGISVPVSEAPAPSLATDFFRYRMLWLHYFAGATAPQIPSTKEADFDLIYLQKQSRETGPSEPCRSVSFLTCSSRAAWLRPCHVSEHHEGHSVPDTASLPFDIFAAKDIRPVRG